MSSEINHLQGSFAETLKKDKTIELIKFLANNDCFPEMILKMKTMKEFDLGFGNPNMLFLELVSSYYVAKEDPELKNRTLLLTNELIKIYYSLVQVNFIDQKNLSLLGQSGLFAKLLQIMAQNGCLMEITPLEPVRKNIPYKIIITSLSNYLGAKKEYYLYFKKNQVNLNRCCEKNKEQVSFVYDFKYEQENQTTAKICNLYKKIAGCLRRPKKSATCKICDRSYAMATLPKNSKHFICEECDSLLRIFASSSNCTFKSIVQKYKRQKLKGRSSKNISYELCANVKSGLRKQAEFNICKIFGVEDS